MGTACHTETNPQLAQQPQQYGTSAFVQSEATTSHPCRWALATIWRFAIPVCIMALLAEHA